MTHSEAVRRLRLEASSTLRHGRAYMKYHAEKFYPEGQMPTGITPCLDKLESALRDLDALPPEPVCEHDRYWKLGDARWCHECGALQEGSHMGWTLPKSRPTQERGPVPGGSIPLHGFSATKDRLIAEVRDSERITARDLAVTVGPVPPPPAQTVDPAFVPAFNAELEKLDYTKRTAVAYGEAKREQRRLESRIAQLQERDGEMAQRCAEELEAWAQDQPIFIREQIGKGIGGLLHKWRSDR